ncbi:MAG TPA: metallophosphoesterase [Acidimicrobiia bacterium]|nr:metallophosphoesterase [Acidimicrobiia bacterium]
MLTIAVAVGLLAAGQTALPAFAADSIAIGSASNGSGDGRVSITIDRPSGTSAGHVMLASIVISDDDPAFTAPAGWTLVRQDTIKDMLRQAIYVKVAGSQEPGSYTWTVPSARRIAGGITTFDGIDGTHPVDAVNGSTNPAVTAVSAPSVTTTVPNTILVELAAVASNGGLTAPGGMTEGWEAAAPGQSTRKNTLGAVASLSYALQPAAGPTGTRTATASVAGRSIGVLLALRPVPAPDTSPPNTTITSGPSGTTTNAFATFTFSATEPSTFLCQLDAATGGEPCTSPWTITNLPAGNHTFAVWATDIMGNADPTPATRSWTISPDSGDPVVNAAGDIAYCGNNNDEATAQLLDNMPGTVVTLGDNVYDSGTASEFSNCYDPTWGRHKARTTPVLGNHEYVTSGASGYFNYFGAVAGDPTQGYYDYRLGAWHVIVLNSNCTAIGGCGAGSPQEQWLRNVLAISDAECTIAVWHHPRFSSGSVHGSNTGMDAFWQALYDYGADVILNGHEHFYERFGMQDPDGTADAVYGLRQITAGTGGRSSYGFGTPLPNSDVRGQTYGVLKMILHDTSYSWEFTPVAGQTFTDSGSSSCHGAPGTPPTLPPPPPPPSGDGIGVVGSIQDGSSVSRATIGLARPSGTTLGDVLVASVATNADATIVPSDQGWTVVRDDVITGALRQAVYVREVKSTDPASYQWTIPEGTRRVTGGITAYRGVATPQSVSVDAVDATMNGSGTAVSAPSITTSVANTMLVQVVGVNAEGTLTAPAGMTEAWEAASPNSGSTRDVLSSSSYALQAATGPTGSRVATASLPGASIGVLLALRPA